MAAPTGPATQSQIKRMAPVMASERTTTPATARALVTATTSSLTRSRKAKRWMATGGAISKAIDTPESNSVAKD